MSNEVHELTNEQKEKIWSELQLSNSICICAIAANYWYFEIAWSWFFIVVGFAWIGFIKDITNNIKHFEMLNAMKDSKE